MSMPGSGKAAESEFAGMRLQSVFQALHDLRAQAVVGHAAWVRPTRDGREVAPAEIFDPARSDADIVRADRLCRLLHAASYHAQGVRATPLLVPVHPRLLESVTADHGRSYREALVGLGLEKARIVISLPDPSHLRTMSLGYLIGSYRLHGFEIAVRLRDASTLHDLLARTRPNMVLLDYRQYANNAAALAGAVKAAQRAGAQAVVTKVESAEMLSQVRAAGANLAQGYYLDKPAQVPADGVVQ
jgi:EAL domain-containing protein (putative c-di-GMP-specific phosphodiesterase class I)